MKDSDNVLGGETNSDAAKSISLSLLDGLQAQEQDAWDRLGRLYGPLVYHWCRRAGLQEADAEDVVQEVFRTVSIRIQDFHREKESDTFRGWVWTITRNKIGDLFRRCETRIIANGGTDAGRRLSEVPQFEESFDSTVSSESGNLFKDAVELIRGEFAERSWQAFWNVVVLGRAPADIAADLDMTVNAVYVAKSRILRRLRDELGESAG